MFHVIKTLIVPRFECAELRLLQGVYSKRNCEKDPQFYYEAFQIQNTTAACLCCHLKSTLLCFVCEAFVKIKLWGWIFTVMSEYCDWNFQTNSRYVYSWSILKLICNLCCCFVLQVWDKPDMKTSASITGYFLCFEAQFKWDKTNYCSCRLSHFCVLFP